jgi:hypothetical protein
MLGRPRRAVGYWIGIDLGSQAVSQDFLRVLP